jgi:hypothetical protein
VACSLTCVLCSANFSTLCAVILSANTSMHSQCIWFIFPFSSCSFYIISLLHVVMAPSKPVFLACRTMHPSTFLVGSSYTVYSSSSLGWPFPSASTLSHECLQLSSLSSSPVVVFSHLFPCWYTLEQSCHIILPLP